MGQSWSAASAASINASLGSGNPYNVALVFGAGYEPAVDDQDPATGPRLMGRGVFIIDAITGSIVRKFVSPSSPSASSGSTVSVSGMDYSIPSDVALVARSHLTNDASNAYRAYVGDTGGNVWRLDIGHTDPNEWVITKLASLGGTGANQRKFLFPPDVVFGGRDSTGSYDYVLIGSGDREHPFNGLVDASGTSLNVNYPGAVTVTNRFYMVKDRDVRENYYGADAPVSGGVTEASLYDATQDLVQSADASVASAAKSSLDTQQGWYITMGGAGEKVVGGATTVAGAVFFGTNRPVPSTANTCGFNLGEAKLYSVDIGTAGAVKNYFIQGSASLSAAGRSTILPGGGLPPTPVPVSVQIGDNKVEGIISGTRVQSTGTGVGSRLRSFIRIIHDKRLPW
jgi:type IV pilus assembly protein PilY1